MSLYQYLYLDKIPNHAIIHEAVDIAKTWWLSHRNIVNGVLRTVMRTELPSFEDIDDTKRIAIQYSLPKWIVDHWVTHFGVEKLKTLHDLLEPVTTTVRANISRDSIDSIISKLEQEGYHVKKTICYHFVFIYQVCLWLIQTLLKKVISLFKIKVQ